MFIIFRRWNEVRFWLYKNFDILDRRDKGENLEGKEFDALVSYRYIIIFMSDKENIFSTFRDHVSFVKTHLYSKTLIHRIISICQCDV